jgi:small GTP-binding protein
MTEDIVYKVLLLGDSTVGKTCFLLRYCDKTFQDAHLSTIGLDYRVKTMTLKNKKNIKLQIWDTAGQDRFRAITKNYYKGANGIILIYDVTNLQTYENVKNWITQIREETNPNVVIYLAGNKIDIPEEERAVKTEEGKEIADEYKLQFKETSAKDGINVNEVFQELVEKIDEVNSKLEVSKPEPKNKLYSPGKKKKSSCC